jgi:glutaredoxin
VAGFLLLVVYGSWRNFTAPTLGKLPQAHDRVIMYSLTTCGFCVQKKQELRAAGIRFEEYYIDTNTAKNAELGEKLQLAGYPPKSYGTPILDVHGFMLPNNPSLEVIQRRLSESGM